MTYLTSGCASQPGQVSSSGSAQETISPQTTTDLQIPDGDPVAGEKVYNSRGCNSCHIARGEGGKTGPKLDGIWGTRVKLSNGRGVIADEAFMRESILVPAAKVAEGYKSTMPNTYTSLAWQDQQNLIAFIASLNK